MAIGHYCARCNSAFCNHCLQINEYNARMEHERYQSGMLMSAPEVTMRIEGTENQITVATGEPKKNKKLLLLRRGK